MEALLSLLTTLNSLSPLAVIALLGVVIFMLVKHKPASEQAITEIKDNHLHELPTIAIDIKIIAETLQRLEVKMSEEFSYLKARINGGRP